MKRFALYLLFLSSLIFWGCPYDSPVPIDDKPTVAIFPELIGTWRPDDYPNDSTEVTFARKSDKVYSINAKFYNRSLSKYASFNDLTGYFSPIKDSYMLNLYDPKSRNYYFIASVLNEYGLTMRLLAEEITEKDFTKSSDLRKFITDIYSKEEIDPDEIYDSDITFNQLKKVN